MKGYNHILVPVDLSDFSLLPLRWAARFRETTGASLTLLHADELFLPSDILEAPMGVTVPHDPASHWRVQERLHHYGKRHLGGRFESMVIQDTPTRAILRAIGEVGAELVIMGTHGRRGLRRAILGSVAENLLHEADIPVFTINPNLSGPSAPREIQRVFCPVDDSPVATEALRHARWIAEAFGAALDAAEAGGRGDWVLAEAAARSADLMVIGAWHKLFTDATVAGTSTPHITRLSPIPVLTVNCRRGGEAHESQQRAANVM